MAYSPPQQYTTPSGQIVSFPPEFASNFRGLSPMQTVQSDQQPATPPGVPADGGLLPPLAPSTEPMPEPPMPAPTVEASPHAPSTPAAQPAAPPPKPSTSAAPAQPKPPDLNKATYGDVLQAQNAATDQQAAADRAAAKAEADSYTAQADAMQRRDQQVDAILQQRQQAAQEKYDRINQATIDANKAVDAYANFKTSREMDHPVLGALSIALSGLGSALAGDNSGRNPALDLINQQLDKKVQMQLAAADRLKDVAGMKKQAIDQVRQLGDDKIAQYNLAMAGETDKAIRQLEQIKTRSQSAQVQANADKLIGQLQGQKAGFLEQGVQRVHAEREAQASRAQQMQMHRETLGVQMRGQDIELAKIAAENDREAAKLALKGKADQAGQVRELGLGDLKDKNGDPYLAPDKESARELRKAYANSAEIDDILNEVSAIRDRVGGESSVFNSDEKQRLDVLQPRLVMLMKQSTQGMSSDEDMNKIAAAMGAKDLTTFRSLSGAIKAAKERNQSALNRQLNANLYTGSPIVFKNAYEKPPTTPEERQFQEAIKKPAVSQDEAERQALLLAKKKIREREGLGPMAEIPAQFNGEILAAMKQAGAESKEISPNTREVIRLNFEAAKKGDAKGDQAFRLLRKMADEGETEAVRDAARQRLFEIGQTPGTPVRDDSGKTTGAAPAPSAIATPDRAVAYEPAPPPSTAEVIAAANGGDKAAIAELVKRQGQGDAEAVRALRNIKPAGGR